MMTLEQQKEVLDFLFAKNLPLDLLVEVEDHMKEQIDALMENGNSFEKAFEQTKINWQRDLEMKFALFRGKCTKLERDAFRETDRNKNLTAAKIMFPYIFITVVMTIYYLDFGKYLIIGGNLIVSIYCIYLIIMNNKLFRSASKAHNRRNISILQRKVSLVMLGATSLFYNVLAIDKSFAMFQNTIESFPRFKLLDSFSLLMPFLYVYAGIVGILYFRDYKKAVEILKQKINFKL